MFACCSNRQITHCLVQLAAINNRLQKGGGERGLRIKKIYG